MLRVLLLTALAAIALGLVRDAGRVLLLIFAGALFALFLSGAARWLATHLRVKYWMALALVIGTTFG